MSSSPPGIDDRIHDFCKRQKELLELELLEDREEETEASSSSSKNSKQAPGGGGGAEAEDRLSNVVTGLGVFQIGVGLYGRTVVAFASHANPNNNKQLLTHRLTPGDEVEIRGSSSSGGSGGGSTGGKSSTGAPGGVICQVTETSISVALFEKNHRKGNASRENNKQQQPSSKKNKNNKDDDDDDDDFGSFDAPPYALVPKSAVQVHAKMVAALDELDRYGTGHEVAGHVVRALFFRGEETAPSSSIPIAQQRNHDSGKPERAATPSNNNGTANAEPKAMSAPPQHPPFNPHLDHSQLEAVAFCLERPSSSGTRQPPVALIHGPPGTGKTTTVAELVLQAVRYHNYRVLITAPSNVAVDNVLLKLVEQQQQQSGSTTTTNKHRNNYKKLSMVRLGHPARLRADILPYSLEHQVQQADETALVADARRELQSYLNVLQAGNSRGRGGSNNNNTKQTRATDRHLARQEIRHLRKEIRVREERIVTALLKDARVVLATCVGAANRLLKRNKGVEFDLVVVDEAAQALEAACWIPALQAKTKLVLAGDHCQLPPTIKSTRTSVQDGLKRTMFERLLSLYAPPSSDDVDGTSGGSHSSSVARMLRVQYRMNQSIANWASHAMYHGKLQSHPTVRNRTLAQLLASKQQRRSPESTNDDENADVDDDGANNDDPPVLLYIDTAGCAMHESVDESSLSRYNVGEVQLVVQHVEYLLNLGLHPKDIAVISPYSGQVQRLKTALQDVAATNAATSDSSASSTVVEVRTVDGFQGGEREAVVLSLVRSSSNSNGGKKNGGSIGFLRDDRRLNVAITRSKRHCCVIGDSETLNTSPFVKGLLEWFLEHGEQRSAVEYMRDNTTWSSEAAIAGASAAAGRSHLMRQTERQMQRFLKDTDAAKNKREEEERTRELVARILQFAERAKSGEELALSSELSKWDRKIVHEQAEKLGTGHRSEGVEGVDRHVILFKLRAAEGSSDTLDNGNEEPHRLHQPIAAAAASTNNLHPDEALAENAAIYEAEEEPQPAVSSTFDALRLVDNDGGGADDGDDDEDEDETRAVEPPTTNSVLADLAKERAERQRHMRKEERSSAQSASKKKKIKKKGGQKLGGTKKPPPPKTVEGMDDLDDMAFLDAQIDEVQSSHGRKIEGKRGYRTVVNGILMGKPNPPPERKKDSRTTAALRTKLKQAQSDRKAKPKKNK